MAQEHQIYHRESGSLGETDEYWTLVVPNSGEPTVKYEALWGNPYKGQVKHAEPQFAPVKEFLKEHNFGTIHDNLIALLAKLRIKP